MAIWQYKLTAIPKETVINKYGGTPERLLINSEDWQEDATFQNWYATSELNAQKTMQTIDQLVPRGHWQTASDAVFWKGDTNNNEDNDCGILFDKKTNTITDFEFRTDLRKQENITHFLVPLLRFCEDHNLMVFNAKGNLFKPQLQLILADIKKLK